MNISKNNILWTVLLVLFLPVLPVQAKPITFQVDDQKNNVSFTSDAPIELIVGRTNKIQGLITVDNSLDLKKLLPKISFDVDLASIDTGIPLRNEHMRDNFLETTKFPKATFNVKTIKFENGSTLIDAKPIKLIANGDFSIHGVTVKRDIPVKVTYLKESELTHNRFDKGDVIRIQSSFDIQLADHKIKRPELILQKLADVVTVTIDAYANSTK